MLQRDIILVLAVVIFNLFGLGFIALQISYVAQLVDKCCPK